jgi:hypothetical protein
MNLGNLPQNIPGGVPIIGARPEPGASVALNETYVPLGADQEGRQIVARVVAVQTFSVEALQSIAKAVVDELRTQGYIPPKDSGMVGEPCTDPTLPLSPLPS